MGNQQYGRHGIGHHSNGNGQPTFNSRFIEVDPITSFDVNRLIPHPDHPSTKSPPLRIGGGSFARVYRAEAGDVTVAVKVLDLSDFKQAGELVQAEAAMMLRVACPQVISLYGVSGVKNDREPPALIMEYAKHGSLESVLKSSEPLPWYRRMRMLTDIARAFIRCHQARPVVVHMDLKPANILVCQGWRAKLGDFGCSKLNEYTRTHSIISGTPVYLAPEARVPGAHPTRAWDVYAFGCTMFAMLTRIEPWAALKTSTELNVELELRKRPIIPPHCPAVIGVPSGFIELMNECWDHDPDRRPSFFDGANCIITRLRAMLSSCDATTNNGNNGSNGNSSKRPSINLNGSGGLSPPSSHANGSLAHSYLHVRTSSDAPSLSLSLSPGGIIPTTPSTPNPPTPTPHPTNNGSPTNGSNTVIPYHPNGGTGSTDDMRALREAKAKSDTRLALQQEELKRLQVERARDQSLIATLRAALAEASRKDSPISSIHSSTNSNSNSSNSSINSSAILSASSSSSNLSSNVHSSSHSVHSSNGYTGSLFIHHSNSPQQLSQNGSAAIHGSTIIHNGIKDGSGTPSPPRSPVPMPPSPALGPQATPTTSSSSAASHSLFAPSAALLANSVSQLYSYCATRDSIAPARLVRRCIDCHSDEIADMTKELPHQRWGDVHGTYDGCVHTNPSSTCRGTKWRFITNQCVCCVTSTHATLPGVMVNPNSLPCEALISLPSHTPRQCGQVSPIIVRFSCGHFTCWRCWRRYACEKIEREEILRQTGYPDPTISCPSGCRSFVRSKALFHALGKARREQYEKICGRMITHGTTAIETTAGRSELKTALPPPPRTKPCPHCKVVNERGPTLSSRMVCHACHYEWCWPCSASWSNTCKQAHLLSYY